MGREVAKVLFFSATKGRARFVKGRGKEQAGYSSFGGEQFCAFFRIGRARGGVYGAEESLFQDEVHLNIQFEEIFDKDVFVGKVRLERFEQLHGFGCPLADVRLAKAGLPQVSCFMASTCSGDEDAQVFVDEAIDVGLDRWRDLPQVPAPLFFAVALSPKISVHQCKESIFFAFFAQSKRDVFSFTIRTTRCICR